MTGLAERGMDGNETHPYLPGNIFTLDLHSDCEIPKISKYKQNGILPNIRSIEIFLMSDIPRWEG